MKLELDLILTQILGFVLFVWLLGRFAWKPLLQMLDERRESIAVEFREAERRQQAADGEKARFEQKLREVEAQARVRIQEAVAEGQKVAAEIKAQAQQDAVARMAAADDAIAREVEKSKELLKQRMAEMSMHAAEKVLREKLDDERQRRLIQLFITELEEKKA